MTSLLLMNFLCFNNCTAHWGEPIRIFKLIETTTPSKEGRCYFILANACSKSDLMSSTCSIPTDKRKRPS